VFNKLKKMLYKKNPPNNKDIEVYKIHQWLTTLYSNRKCFELEQILKNPIKGCEDLWYFHKVQLTHFYGKPFGNNEELLIFCNFETYEKYPFLKKSLLNMKIKQFLMTENIKQIIEFTKELSEKETQLISKPYLFGIIKFLIKYHFNEEAKHIMIDIIKNQSPEKRIYFLELAMELNINIGFPYFNNWIETMNYFQTLFNSKIEDDSKYILEKFIISPLRNIPKKLDYMDIRSSNENLQKLSRIILSAIKEKKPLSMIRLGDGEAYGFENDMPIETNKNNLFDLDNEFREFYWWGENPEYNISLKIKKQLFDAINNSDILAIPSIYRVIRDYDGTFNPLERRSTRGLIAVLHGFSSKLSKKEKIITEERCHQILFTEKFLKQLVDNAMKTVVVSCWNKEQINSSYIKNANFIKISPPMKVNDSFSNETPLFYNYESIINKIKELSGPGTLVIVSAGVIGKIFIDCAKSNGAVAIDLGAVIDYLAGRKTRSPADII
jgi:hypothetical protein